MAVFGIRSYRRKIQTVFAATADLYYEFWGPFFHLAIFDDPALDLHSAFEYTHNQHLAAIRGPDSRRILDLACGGGAFAEWLAKRTRAEVLGIDISDVQLERARKRVRPNLRFRKHDIMDLGSLNEAPFDAAVCLDAAVYLPDKRRAIEQVAGLLEPHARFLLVDWCRPEHVTALQQELVLAPLYRCWGMLGMETVERYRRHLTAVGFRLVECHDLSDRVRRNWDLGCDAAHRALAAIAPGRAAGAALRFGGRPLVSRWAKAQYHAVLFARAASEAGLLRYIRFVAERA